MLRLGPLCRLTALIVRNSNYSCFCFLVVGNGFFTMKHKWTNIRDKMHAIYKDLDSFSMHRIVFYEMERLNETFFHNFLTFNRHSAQKRLLSTPAQLTQAFQTKYEMSSVQRLANGMNEFNDGFTKSRICVGQETDSKDQPWQSSTKQLW